MSEAVLDATLEALAGLDDDALASHIAATRAREFLRRPDLVDALVHRLAEVHKALDPAAALLFERILDEARMARENGVDEGERVLAVAEAALSGLRDAGRLPPPLRMVLAQIYASVGLEPADAVLIHPEEFGAVARGSNSGGGGPRIEDLIDDIVGGAGEEPLEIHATISRMIAVFPPAVRGTFVAAIVAGERPFALRLGVYWLLDRNGEVRLAVAEVFRDRAVIGQIDASTLARLVAVRKWLPAEPARTVLDEAVKSALRREIGGARDERNGWTVHRVVASLPDGAGAQSIAVALQRGHKRSVAMLLSKQGHGLKDAFFLPCSGAAEQKRILTGIAREMGGIDVDATFVSAAVARALGDGAAAGRLPAPGLVDMAEIWGDAGITPSSSDPSSIIAEIDADGVVRALSARDIAKLTGENRQWRDRRNLSASWFEDDSALRDRLDRQTSTRAAEAMVWKHLENRRIWWATVIARTAATLRAATTEPDVWLAFAATSQALVDGRPLKKIAIMATIAEQTLLASAERLIDEFEDAIDDEENSPDVPVAFTSPKQELPGEFAAMIAGSGRTTAWIEGHLAANAAAPVFVHPADWIGSLLGAMRFADLATVNRFLELLMARGNAIVDPAVGPGRIAATLAAHDATGKRDWAAGFTAFVTGVKSAWPSRALAPDDKRVLKSLAKAANSGIDDGLARLLPEWISHRYRGRR